MQIGSVNIDSKLVLAPMAGVTDLAFRTICRELGAGYTITEMVSAKALCYQDKKTLPLMAVAVSFLVSGYGGLYAKQKFAFSKSASPEGLAHTDRREHDEPR